MKHKLIIIAILSINTKYGMQEGRGRSAKQTENNTGKLLPKSLSPERKKIKNSNQADKNINFYYQKIDELETNKTVDNALDAALIGQMILAKSLNEIKHK